MVNEKGNKSCDECGDSLKDEDLFHHEGKNYCVECMTVHIKDEHIKLPKDKHIKGEPLATPEGRRAWTYKST